MTKKDNHRVDRELLRRSKESSGEQKLDWLASAQEFARAANMKRPSQKSPS